MPFVLDASLALAWHFEDEASAYADRVLDRLGEDQAVVPSLWALEIANALVVAERRGRLSAADVARAADQFLGMPVSIQEESLQSALGPALALARTHKLSAYDAAYLELAMREGLPIATEDGTLRAAAKKVGVPLVE